MHCGALASILNVANAIGVDRHLLQAFCCVSDASVSTPHLPSLFALLTTSIALRYDIENIPVARQAFDAELHSRDMWETYMPAFKACITKGKSSHVMCSYNAVSKSSATASARSASVTR